MICGMVKKKTRKSDSPVPEDEKHIKESEEDASEEETPSDNSED